MKSIIFILCILCASEICFSQQDNSVRDDFPSDNLSFKDANKRSNRPKRKKISLIYVPNANKILYGNQCVLQETHKMGFEYIVEPANTMGSRSSMGKFLNNFWVKTKLVGTRSPFWRQILNSKIRKCRKMSGDLVG